MTNFEEEHQPPDALDELVERLIVCGSVIGSMIAGMTEFEASGRGAPDAPPVEVVAHDLIRSVMGPVAARHPAVDIDVAAAVVEEATVEICENIFTVNMDGPPCQPPRMVGLGPPSRLPRR